MSVRSMTGFARVRKTTAEGEIVFSLKSVNHRGLDLHFHLPPELDALENDVRAVIKTGLVRGHVQIHVTFTRGPAAGQAPVNWTLLDAYMGAFREACERYRIEGTPDLNAALRVPGVLSANGEDSEVGEEVSQAVLEAAAEAVASLNVFREREGAATAREMRQRCDNLGGLVDRMETIRTGAVAVFHKR